jgi:hypothetical protein
MGNHAASDSTIISAIIKIKKSRCHATERHIIKAIFGAAKDETEANKRLREMRKSLRVMCRDKILSVSSGVFSLTDKGQKLAS